MKKVWQFLFGWIDRLIDRKARAQIEERNARIGREVANRIPYGR